MTKADLARSVYNRHGGVSIQDASRIVDLIFTIIKNQLLGGEEIHIVGFGTFEIVERQPRRGRNPVTGEAMDLLGKRALVFRPARGMKSV
jgi:DNA-binding protein HU-beta